PINYEWISWQRLKMKLSESAGNIACLSLYPCYADVACSLCRLLADVDSKISFTHDVWTAKNVSSFMGVTMHWIDKHWKLQSALMDFIPLTGKHTGRGLCNAFAASLKQFDIAKKVTPL